MVLLSGRLANVVGLVTSVLSDGYTSSSRGALNKILWWLSEVGGGPVGSDLTGTGITRTKAQR